MFQNGTGIVSFLICFYYGVDMVPMLCCTCQYICWAPLSILLVQNEASYTDQCDCPDTGPHPGLPWHLKIPYSPPSPGLSKGTYLKIKEQHIKIEQKQYSCHVCVICNDVLTENAYCKFELNIQIMFCLKMCLALNDHLTQHSPFNLSHN